MNSQASCETTQLDPELKTVAANCETHGPYTAKQFAMFGGKPITSTCPACREEYAAKEKEREAERVRRDRAERIARMFQRSGIPARFADRTLDNYAAGDVGQKRALKIAQRFVATFTEDEGTGASLVFAGKPGTGKTHLACGIGKALTENLRSVLFMTVTQALRHIKDTYRKDASRSESDAIRDLLKPDLLILDEIGVQLGSEHEKMLMFEVINERYQNCLSTILISNLTGEELNVFLGDRVMDRFREAGAIVAFDWQSHRGKQA